jgi:hypothetical protein
MSTNDTPKAGDHRIPDASTRGRSDEPHLNAKIAETSRQERQQGGQHQLTGSGDITLNAAGSIDKPELATGGTEDAATSGDAVEDDMAPGG